MKLPVHRTSSRNSNITVRTGIWGAPSNAQLLAQAIRVYQHNQRQGTSKVQSRGEVTLTTRKWYRQKGTGNARHGAKSAPIFVGGGVTHGPRGNRNWDRKMTKSQARRALVTALSMQYENTIISADLDELTGKTKEAANLLQELATERDAVAADDSILVVLSREAGNFEVARRAFSNIPYVTTVTATQLTTHDVAAADSIIFAPDAIDVLETRLEEIADKIEAALETSEVEKE